MKKYVLISFILSLVIYYAPLFGSNKSRCSKAQKLINRGLYWSYGFNSRNSYVSLYDITRELRILPLSAICAISQLSCFRKWKNSSYIINHLTNNIPTMSHYSWTKESRTLNKKFNNILSVKRITKFNDNILSIKRITKFNDNIFSVKRITKFNDNFFRIKVYTPNFNNQKFKEISENALSGIKISYRRCSKWNHKVSFRHLKQNLISNNTSNDINTVSLSSTNLVNVNNGNHELIAPNIPNLNSQNPFSHSNIGKFSLCLSWNTNGWNFMKRDSIEYFNTIFKSLFL